MSPLRTAMLSSAICLLSTVLFAQASYNWSPPNTGKMSGGNNNTIPFWSASATYQQIHDQSIFSSTSLLMKGLGMRPAGNRTVSGRSWDMRLTMSHTKVSAFNASTTFSNNLGTGITTIVVGSATTWKNFSWKTFTTSGMTPAFTIPFNTTYTYLAPLGNLCWEWRHKNGTLTTSMPMDASRGLSQTGTTLAGSGTGCTATGQTVPSTATLTAVRTSSSAYQHHLELQLSRGTSNANAMLAIGLSSTTANVGWCAPIMTPMLLLPGKTDAVGTWMFKAGGIQQLAGAPVFTTYIQYGFADAGQVAGIGLTNVGGWTSPNVPGAHGLSRIYKSVARSTSNGDELATSGSMTRGYGLSIAWLK